MYDSERGVASGNLIDLRSDTVTKPCQGMRKAMADAEVGDDVYGDDPTVRHLEEFTAELLGKEAGLFVTSGTQSNLVALLTHCGRGDEYIGGIGYHISKYEAGGAAVLGGISPRHLSLNETGGLDPSNVEAAIQPDDPHFAITRLVCLENTYNGRVQDQANMKAVSDTARSNSLSVHLDGARLMNAAVASGTEARNLAEIADTVSLCLSKGLGAPVGSVLCGPAEFINKARRNRKLVGGGMRQSGILAAAGLYALNHNIERLEEDHTHAAELSRVLTESGRFELKETDSQTSMIWLEASADTCDAFGKHMLSNGICISPNGNSCRLVMHRDVSAEDVNTIAGAISSF